MLMLMLMLMLWLIDVQLYIYKAVHWFTWDSPIVGDSFGSKKAHAWKLSGSCKVGLIQSDNLVAHW